MRKFVRSGSLITISFFILVGAGTFYLLNKNDEPVEPSPTQSNTALKGPKVTLTANDGTSITARPYLVKEAPIGVVIIHDIDKDRSETMQFAEELAVACKCSTIAIDLRGHGQSQGNKDDFANMHQDAIAAEKYLKEQGAQDLSYIGFGFGAHIALKAATEANSAGVVLVSPDMDNRDVNSLELINHYQGRLLISASETDIGSNNLASKLFNLSKTQDKQFAEYQSGGHGIQMVYDTDLGKIIKDWLIQTNSG